MTDEFFNGDLSVPDEKLQPCCDDVSSTLFFNSIYIGKHIKSQFYYSLHQHFDGGGGGGRKCLLSETTEMNRYYNIVVNS